MRGKARHMASRDALLHFEGAQHRFREIEPNDTPPAPPPPDPACNPEFRARWAAAEGELTEAEAEFARYKEQHDAAKKRLAELEAQPADLFTLKEVKAALKEIEAAKGELEALTILLNNLIRHRGEVRAWVECVRSQLREKFGVGWEQSAAALSTLVAKGIEG